MRASLQASDHSIFSPRIDRLTRWLLAAAAVTAMLLLISSTAHAGNKVSARIINGGGVAQDRHDTMWPFIISLGETSGNARESHFCGATLIKPRLVLTAAHCVVELDEDVELSVKTFPSTIAALGGASKLSTASSGQRIAVRDIMVHPKYKSTEEVFDVAILRLNRPFTVGGAVRTIDIAGVGEDGFWGAGGGLPSPTEATGPWTAGWGNTVAWDRGESFPDELRDVMLPLASDSACQAKNPPGLGDLGFDLRNMLCGGLPDSDASAGNGTTGKDTCQGDSGGPVIAGDGLGAWRVFGVVSWGEKCGGIRYAAYTRLAAQRAWIQSIDENSYGPGGIQPPRTPKVVRRSRSSVTLRWSAPAGGPRPASYAIYLMDGGLYPIAVSSRRQTTISGLDSGSRYDIYIVARGRDKSESSLVRRAVRTQS